MAVGTDLQRYEAALREQGFARVAGVDEAGRGALAGPLVAAAVIIPVGFDPVGIRDSKQLTPRQRDVQFKRITDECIVAVAKAEAPVLDRRGLHRSNIALLRRATRALDPGPDYVLTDGFPVPRMPCPALSIKKGDVVSASVAAASIVANKGYGTRDHWVALETHGPTPVHRLSFAGVGQPSLPGLSERMSGPRESMRP
jgi:ribonuclease HII